MISQVKQKPNATAASPTTTTEATGPLPNAKDPPASTDMTKPAAQELATTAPMSAQLTATQTTTNGDRDTPVKDQTKLQEIQASQDTQAAQAKEVQEDEDFKHQAPAKPMEILPKEWT